LVTDILQNIFFCALQKIEMHKGLEQLEGEQMMTDFLILGGTKCNTMEFKVLLQEN